MESTMAYCKINQIHVSNKPFPYSNKKLSLVTFRVDKNAASVWKCPPNLTLLLLFQPTEVECGKVLLCPLWYKVTIILNMQLYKIYMYTNHTSGQNNRERAISFQIFGKNFQPISKKSFDSVFAFSEINK